MSDIKDESVMVFIGGGRRCSLPIAEVERVAELRAVQIYPLLIANAALRGLINIDGQVVALVRFPHVREDADTIMRCVLVSGDGRRFAFAVERVLGVQHAEADPDTRALTARTLWNEILAEAGIIA